MKNFSDGVLVNTNELKLLYVVLVILGVITTRKKLVCLVSFYEEFQWWSSCQHQRIKTPLCIVLGMSVEGVKGVNCLAYNGDVCYRNRINHKIWTD